MTSLKYDHLFERLNMSLRRMSSLKLIKISTYLKYCNVLAWEVCDKLISFKLLFF